MVQEPEDGRSHPEEEEDGGGPVKTFLEHLEDLRWTLVKCLVSLVLAMVICLVAGKFLVAVLMWPLNNAEHVFHRNRQGIPVLIGTSTNAIGRVQLGEFGAGLWDSNVAVGALRLMPMRAGTNTLLVVQAEPGAAAAAGHKLVSIKNYSPVEGILVAMKLALYGGLVLAAPFLLLFIGQFVLPALKVHEKRLLYHSVGIGSVLFFIGVTFCYFIVSAIALGATVQFSQWLGFAADEWRADAYIGFMCKFMLGMGVAFELPVVILTLVKIGLLDYEKLVGFRTYAIIGNLVVAAFATPSGDPITMMVMAAPMQLLYEISLFICWLWERKARRLAQAEQAQGQSAA
ncbi:MAG: twin-arginine translocase subunit TatC [Verrucomicrobia bacterium]|nr:twin-arginine translocase subunit TatC [Verrucomicrobiota bacterium]